MNKPPPSSQPEPEFFIKAFIRGLTLIQREELAGELDSSLGYMNRLASRDRASVNAAMRMHFSLFNCSLPPEQRYTRRQLTSDYWERDIKRFAAESEVSTRLNPDGFELDAGVGA